MCKVKLLYVGVSMQIDERTSLIQLFDTYGGLLSEKQFYVAKKILELDLGESELADASGKTRQSVHDAAIKAKRQLAEFEEKCRFVELKNTLKTELCFALNSLEENKTDNAKKIIKNLLENL